MSPLARELEAAFKSLNKARMDLERHVRPKESVWDETYGYILDSSAIDLARVNRANKRVKASFAFPGEKDSEVRLVYSHPSLARRGVKEIATLHGLRTSYDPHQPITLALARRLSAKELGEARRRLERAGYLVHDVRKRRSVVVGRGFFTDPRHLRVFDREYDLVAAVPEEHNVLTVFEVCEGAEAAAAVLGALKK
jgi:hypothetical protein